jgi:hypothetical protein
MPVFHRGGRQVLFVHVPRTAGQSVEAWFGLDATRAAPDRDALLGRELRDDAPYELFGGKGFLLAHLTPAELVRFGYLPDRDRYLSFCTVRDPLERVVSTYRSRPRDEPFDAWLPTFLEAHDHPYRTPQSAFVFDGRGHQQVTDVLRYETLDRGLRFFGRRYGLALNPASLPRLGVSRGPEVVPSPGDVDRVLDAFHEDFDLFGYRKEALLERTCRRIRRDGTLMVTFLSEEQLPLFEVWWRHARAFPMKDMLVVCHDEASAFAARARGLATYTLRCAPDRFTTARERARFLKQVIDGGADVIHSDIGAMWFRDVRPLLADHPADWQLGIAHDEPGAAVAGQAFACDLGFWHCRSNERTRRAWSRLVDLTEELGDLRTAFHALLKKGRVRWEETTVREERVTSAAGTVGSYGMRLRVLPGSVVSRSKRQGVSVYHPVLGEGPVREQLLRLHELLGGGPAGPQRVGVSPMPGLGRGRPTRRLESPARSLGRSSSSDA